MAMTETTSPRLRAVITALAPVMLLAAFVWHPYIAGRLPNDSAIADVAADPTRWGLAHLAADLASGVVILAFIAVRSYLRERGEDRWSAFGLPLIVIGSTLYALLPGPEFAPLAAVEAGADAKAVQAALASWFVPILITGSMTFALGILGFVTGIARNGGLSRGLAWLVVVALIVMAASRFVPLFAVQGYVQATAALLALWPLAHRMWTRSPSTVRKSTSGIASASE
jgi:hypothetical protein